MLKQIYIPRIDSNSETVLVVDILKEVGSHVKIGDELCSLETLKAITQLESTETGYIREVLIKKGQDIPPLSPAFVLVDEISELNGAKSTLTSSDNSFKKKTEFFEVTAKARQLADQSGVDIAHITPADGNIVRKEDVLRYVESNLPSTMENETNNQKEASREFETFSAYLEIIVDSSLFEKKLEKIKREASFKQNIQLPLFAWYCVQAILKQSANGDSIDLGFDFEADGKKNCFSIAKAEQLTPVGLMKEFFALTENIGKGIVPGNRQPPALLVTSLADYDIVRCVSPLPQNCNLVLFQGAVASWLDNKPRRCIGATFNEKVHATVKIAKLLQTLKNELEQLDGAK